MAVYWIECRVCSNQCTDGTKARFLARPSNYKSTRRRFMSKKNPIITTTTTTTKQSLTRKRSSFFFFYYYLILPNSPFVSVLFHLCYLFLILVFKSIPILVLSQKLLLLLILLLLRPS